MKKGIGVVLFMFFAAAAAFCVSGDTLMMSASVEPIPPVFIMYGTFNPDYETDAKSTAGEDSSARTLSAELGIDPVDLDVYVRIAQTNSSTYLNAPGLMVSIEASDLKLDGTSETCKVSPSVVAATRGGQDTEDMDNTTAPMDLGDGKVGKSFLPKYKTGAFVDGFEVGKIQFRWSVDDTIPSGFYSATITLTFTV